MRCDVGWFNASASIENVDVIPLRGVNAALGVMDLPWVFV
jgi:hypothetical protein